MKNLIILVTLRMEHESNIPTNFILLTFFKCNSTSFNQLCFVHLLCTQLYTTHFAQPKKEKVTLHVSGSVKRNYLV